jgi:hypothetical protein
MFRKRTKHNAVPLAEDGGSSGIGILGRKRVDNRLNRRRSVAFKAVVHEQEGRFLSSSGVPDHSLQRVPHAGVRFLNPIVWLERLHRSVIGSVLSQERPRDDEIGRVIATSRDLVFHLRHPGPRADDMGDVVRRQQRKVVNPQIVVVADLDRVPKPLGERREEGVEPCEEIGRLWEPGLVERAEFDDERPDSFLVRLEAFDEEPLKCLGVEEMLVR